MFSTSGTRSTSAERYGRAARALEPPGLLELALHRDEVDALAPVGEREARLVDEPVRLAREVLRHEELHDARQERRRR